MHHIESQGIICETQFGFRQNHSCETQLLLTVDDFARALDHNNQVDVGILDMSKAFDKVPHERLGTKTTSLWYQGKCADLASIIS